MFDPRTTGRAVVCASLLITAAPAALAQTVIHVDADAAPGGDGSTWRDAYNNLETALASRTDPGDEIWVAEGSYTPVAMGDFDSTFIIPEGVGVYGGFDGTETRLRDRDPDVNVTILDGQGPIARVSHVVTIENNIGFTLDGFIIQNGLSGPGDPTPDGAGIRCVASFGTFNDLHIRDCEADGLTQTGNGGGLAAIGLCNVVVTSCVFERCSGENGGAIYAETRLTIADTDFIDNTSFIFGGALHLIGGGNFEITGCNFNGNSGLGGGSGIYASLTRGSPTAPAGLRVTDCDFIDGNSTFFGASAGGGISIEGEGTHVIRSSRFIGNAANIGGAISAVLAVAGDSLTVENCAILANIGGGIAHASPGELHVNACTIAHNSASNNPGAGIYTQLGDCFIDNTIIWGNNDNRGASTTLERNLSTGLSPTGPLVINTCIAEGWDLSLPGLRNTGADPSFTDIDGPDDTPGTADDSAAIAPGSPAIDAGDNRRVAATLTLDVAGQPRFRDDTGVADTGIANDARAIVDIGAFEFQGTTPRDCPADTNGDGIVSPADFNAWILAFNSMSPACDQNGDGLCTPADFNAWILNFNAGCP